jgi:two-component system chemotaxis response regulator CheY
MNAQAKSRSEQVLAGTRILTLDDDANMRSIIRSILQQCGCPDILQASNGRDALKLFTSRPIDLVICDWMMEPMNGFQFLTDLRRFDKGASVPVIMLTGNSEPADALAAQHLNIGAWLVKPVAPKKLVERISSVLSLPTKLFSIEEDLNVDLSQFARQYRAKLSTQIGDLEKMVKNFKDHNRNEIVDHWSSIVRLFHTVKGQAGMFDYNLVTTLAGIGQDLLRQAEGNVEVLVKFQSSLQRALSVLVTAMSLVLQGDIKGKGGNVGDRLLGKINEATLPVRQMIEAELKHARRT